MHLDTSAGHILQLGQASVNPPDLCLKWGGGTSAHLAWLPAKLKSPPLQEQVWGGSRWADLAVEIKLKDIAN